MSTATWSPGCLGAGSDDGLCTVGGRRSSHRLHRNCFAAIAASIGAPAITNARANVPCVFHAAV